tara:strand:+ start:533 stop:709 length:177 start_codon:yes stop_codon:yes gene_type:complete
MDFILDNWPEILLSLLTAAGTISALTETEKDDDIVDMLKRILSAIVLGRSYKKPTNNE